MSLDRERRKRDLTLVRSVGVAYSSSCLRENADRNAAQCRRDNVETFNALAFQNGLEHRDADVKRLNVDDPPPQHPVRVGEGELSFSNPEFTKLKRVQLHGVDQYSS